MRGVTALKLDVTNGGAVAAVVADIGPLDVLFNCAGYVAGGTILECDEKDWDFSFDLNVKAMYRLIRLTLPAMLEKGGGSIINMSSVASSLKGVPNRFVYCASKAAVIGMTKAIAADFVTQGVRCNAISPGGIYNGQPEEFVERLRNLIPMGRMADEDEYKSAIVFLCSNASAYMTGQNLIMDGGRSVL